MNVKRAIPGYSTSIYNALVKKCLKFFKTILPIVSYKLYAEHCKIHRQELAIKMIVQEIKNKKVIDATEDVHSALTEEGTADVKTINSIIDSKVVAKINKKFDELKSLLANANQGKGKHSHNARSASSPHSASKTP